jgi:hypothetical protein
VRCAYIRLTASHRMNLLPALVRLARINWELSSQQNAIHVGTESKLRIWHAPRAPVPRSSEGHIRIVQLALAELRTRSKNLFDLIPDPLSRPCSVISCVFSTAVSIRRGVGTRRLSPGYDNGEVVVAIDTRPTIMVRPPLAGVSPWVIR